MGIYIKLFDTHSQYESYTADTANFILPNVSYCKDVVNVVHYNPYVEPIETRVVAKFNVTDTNSPTPISYKYSSQYSQYDGTSGFSSIEIDDVEQPYVVSAYTFDTIGEHIVKYTLTDPTRIGEFAFTNCYSLTSIEIPSNVTIIGDKAFSSCSALTSIVIPDSVTSIGSSVFSRCSGLTSCTIGSGVTSIGNSAFDACSGLTSIDIPSGVTSIGSGAFQYCKSLTSVGLVGSGASIEIPNSITNISASLFYYCNSLTTVTIGSGVTSIGDEAFRYCSSLTSITVNAVTPPTLGGWMFSDTGFGFQIYVPSSSVDTYKAASGWSNYASRIQAIP